MIKSIFKPKTLDYCKKLYQDYNQQQTMTKIKQVSIGVGLVLATIIISLFVSSYTSDTAVIARLDKAKLEQIGENKVEWAKLDDREKKLNEEIMLIKKAKYFYNQCNEILKKTMGTKKVIDCNNIGYYNGNHLVNDKMIEYNWHLNKDGYSQDYIELNGNTVKERATDLLAKMNKSLSYEQFAKYKEYNIKPEVVICIAKADSSLGNQLTSKNNIGNVGNFGGKLVEYDTMDAGIEAIFKALNNKHLGEHTMIGQLSPDGGGNGPYYATGQNWLNNNKNCLSMIYDKQIDDVFEFRN